METEEKKLIVTADEVIEYLGMNLNRLNDVIAFLQKWAQETVVVIEGLEEKQKEYGIVSEQNTVEGAD